MDRSTCDSAAKFTTAQGRCSARTFRTRSLSPVSPRTKMYSGSAPKTLQIFRVTGVDQTVQVHDPAAPERTCGQHESAPDNASTAGYKRRLHLPPSKFHKTRASANKKRFIDCPPGASFLHLIGENCPGIFDSEFRYSFFLQRSPAELPNPP
jgi:hypothetical protein